MGSYLLQSPSAPLKGGIPLSTEIPAPVKATRYFDLETTSAALSNFLLRFCIMLIFFRTNIIEISLVERFGGGGQNSEK